MGKEVLTKADLVEAVQSRMGFSKQVTTEIVDDLFEIIKETLVKGESVKVSGFGNFQIREKKARRGRNPRTGEEITISPRLVLGFKPSQVLRRAVRDNS